MSNHHRGLWGYHGETAAGAELTVQATGIGGPSAAIVIGELAELGVRRAIRVGTCHAMGPSPRAGTRLVVAGAIAADGTSAALGAAPGESLRPDERLTEALAAAPGCALAWVLSRDLPPSETAAEPGGPEVGDLQTAAVLTATRRLGIRAAACLVVGAAGGRRLEDEPLESRLLELASAAAAALQPSGSGRA